jgi:4-hydroxybenzoate polyprenyltransferase
MCPASHALPLLGVPAIIRGMLNHLLRAMRPRQWIKNLLVFSALLFDQQLFTLVPLVKTMAGFVLLCLAASSVYLINDLADAEQDRQHPKKMHRPIASGDLPVRTAQISIIVLLITSISSGFLLDTSVGLLLLGYILLNLLYSTYLKHIPIIDVMVLASNFLLRVSAGVLLITVQRFSPWMYVCVTLLALFVGLGKRRAEMVLLADNANSHRKVLDGYTIPYVDHLLTIVSSTTIVAYSLYTFSAENLPDNHLMMLTIPFVIYGVFRYLYLVHVEGAGGAPEDLLLTDRSLFSTVLLWGLSVILILYLQP